MRPQERHEGVRVERLAQKSGPTGRSRAFREQVVVRGDEDDGDHGALAREQISKIEAAQPAEVNIEHDAVGLPAHGAVQELLRGAEGLHANAVSSKRPRECGAKRGVVIDDADPGLVLAKRV